MPPCPPWLSREAKAAWRRLAPELFRLGLLTCVDGDALAVYCDAWGSFRWAVETLAREGYTTPGTGGATKKHPAVLVKRLAVQAIKSYSALFGLNPADRSRLSVPDASQVDELAEFEKYFRDDGQGAGGQGAGGA